MSMKQMLVSMLELRLWAFELEWIAMLNFKMLEKSSVCKLDLQIQEQYCQIMHMMVHNYLDNYNMLRLIYTYDQR